MLNNEMPSIGFYIMSGLRMMDGPFDTVEEASEELGRMCGEYTSPELLSQFLARFDGITLDLVKGPDGSVIDGNYIRSR